MRLDDGPQNAQKRADFRGYYLVLGIEGRMEPSTGGNGKRALAEFSRVQGEEGGRDCDCDGTVGDDGGGGEGGGRWWWY